MAQLFFYIFFCFLIKTNCLECYSCQFSFNDIGDSDHRNMWCTNETILKIPKKQVIKPCAPWENWCITAITTSLNSFTSVSRSCAIQCPINCDSIGYGQNQVTCADCCKNNKCNKQFSVDYYKTVMARQFTGWSQPGVAEKEFNQKNNIRFPY